MEVLKLLLLVTVLSLTISRTLCICEVPEFQYPCYIDVCTFPKQYCNSEERICSPCSRALCHAPKVPTACRYICIKYNELSTTQSSKTSTVTTALNLAENDSDSTLLYLVIFSTSATTVLTVSLIFAVIHFYRKAKKAKQNYTVQKESGGHIYTSVEQVKEVVPNAGNSVIQEPNHVVNVCPLCSLSSLPSYKALDPRTNMRPNPPIVDAPTDSENSIASTNQVVTNNTRLQGAVASTASIVTGVTLEGDSLMHLKPWSDGPSVDVGLQSDMIVNFNSNQNGDATLPKVPNV
ncbi:hypothetical protein ACF0H5_000223 [Mactra antiquata]